jgi:hypothetical protein
MILIESPSPAAAAPIAEAKVFMAAHTIFHQKAMATGAVAGSGSI